MKIFTTLYYQSLFDLICQTMLDLDLQSSALYTKAFHCSSHFKKTLHTFRITGKAWGAADIQDDRKPTLIQHCLRLTTAQILGDILKDFWKGFFYGEIAFGLCLVINTVCVFRVYFNSLVFQARSIILNESVATAGKPSWKRPFLWRDSSHRLGPRQLMDFEKRDKVMSTICITGRKKNW